MAWDFVIAALVGLIDANPLPDFVLTPITWALIFFTGN